jgi:hypothetical protein
MEFAYDGDGIGKGGDVTLYVYGGEVAEGRVERTHLFTFSIDETTEVGGDAGAPVSEDDGPRDKAFNGTVAWGPGRHRRSRRRPGPPHRPRGTIPDRHGAPVMALLPVLPETSTANAPETRSDLG